MACAQESDRPAGPSLPDSLRLCEAARWQARLVLVLVLVVVEVAAEEGKQELREVVVAAPRDLSLW